MHLRRSSGNRDRHFLERFAPGSFAKTIRERKGRIRALFEHGLDLILGRQVIADIEEMREEPDGAYYSARLLPGVPDLILSGLKRGLYGSSIRFSALKVDRVRPARATAHNPEKLPEVTVREARVQEFSIVTFPAYAGATARVRSLTDVVATRRLIGNLVTANEETILELTGDPERLAALRQLQRTHEPARRRPVRDYLASTPTWRLPDPDPTPTWRL